MIGPIGIAPSPDLFSWCERQNWRKWAELEQGLGDRVAQMNGAYRARAETAKVPTAQGYRVVAAGVLNGTARVIDFDARGGVFPMDDATANFFGLHETTARACLHMVLKYHPDFDQRSPKDLREFLTTLSVPLCEVLAPIEMWRITTNGVEPILETTGPSVSP
jgi:hypothetical protein